MAEAVATRANLKIILIKIIMKSIAISASVAALLNNV